MKIKEHRFELNICGTWHILQNQSQLRLANRILALLTAKWTIWKMHIGCLTVDQYVYQCGKGKHQRKRYFLYNMSCCIRYLHRTLQGIRTIPNHNLFRILLQGLYHWKAYLQRNFILSHLRTIFINSWKWFLVTYFVGPSSDRKN